MIRTLQGFLPKGRLGRAVTVLVSGTALGQIIILAASPLLTRFYTPEDFGILGVFSALLGIFGVAICLCYELAIPLAEDDASGVNLLALSVVVTAIVSSAAGVVFVVWGDTICGWLNADGLRPLLWLLPVGLCTMGCARALIHWAIRRQEFGRITRTRVSRAIGQVVVQVGCGFLALGPIGLLVGQIIGQSAGITNMTLAFHRKEGRLWAAIRVREMARMAGRFAHLPKFGAGATLLNNGGRLAPTLLVAALYGPEVAGWFALAQRILATPAFFGVAVSQVYLGEVPRLDRDGGDGHYGLFKATAWRLLVFGGLALSPLIIAGPQLFALIFGSVWTEAGRFAQFLAFMSLGHLVVSSVSHTLTVLERQDVRLLWDALRFGALLLVFLVAQQLEWSPLVTIAVVSAVMTLGQILMFLQMRRMLLAHREARIERV